jgi:protein CrcB
MGFIFVALGGAVGAIMRYSISLLPERTCFPILTLITNIIGAIVIGFIVGLAEEKQVSSNAMLFLKTGVCGGFTTFSTFSLEVVTLFDHEKFVLGGIYIVLSVSACIVGVYCGRKIATMML